MIQKMVFPILLISMIWGHVANTSAQTDRAVLAFEVQPKALIESELIGSLELKEQLVKTTDRRWKTLFEADSIRGLLTTPESMEAIEKSMRSDSAPMDFYVRFEFDNADQVEAMKKEFVDRSTVTEKSGYTELRPKREGSDIYLAFGDKWIVFASDDYDVSEKSLQRLSPALKNWKKDSSAALQMAGDIDAARDFLNEFSDVIRQEAPPLAFLIPMFKQVDFLTIAVKPDAEEMIVINGKSADAKTAEQFRESLLGLIAMGKFGINQVGRKEPIADIAAKVLDEMRPTQDGKDVQLIVKLPEGLGEELQESIAAARQSARAAQRMNDVKQVALALHNYADSYRKFPFTPREQDSPGLSWRVRILPYLEESRLYDMFDLTEAWDSETNKRLLELQPLIYGGSEDNSMVCWVKSDVLYFDDLTDGTSNTIAFIVAPKQMNWTEPNDLSVDEAVKIFKDVKEGETLIVGFYDGSVQRIAPTMDADEFRKFLTPAGGEVVNR